MRWGLAAISGILACAAAADRPSRHFLAVTSTSYNSTVPGPPSQILLFDRETGAQFAHFDFNGPAYAPAVTADGSGLYFVVTGQQPGIGVIEVGSAQVRSFLSVPELLGGFTIADDRILVTSTAGITAVDLAATRILATVPCPAGPQRLVYDGVNGYAYATMFGRQDLCVATPDLDPGTPILTPLGAHETISTTVLLDNNVLLVTTYAGGLGPYKSFAVDLVSGRSAPVPSLDAVYPISVSPDDPSILFGSVTVPAVIAYKVAFTPDGVPSFTAQGPARNAAFHDDRYVYVGVSGYCSTPEGPVVCSVGFRMLEPDTLAELRSFVFAQQTAFGLFAPRGINLTVSAVRPFGSSVSPPRHSRR